MLAATLLALASAGLHAGWNLAAKRSADRFVALWGQFFVAAVIGGVILAATRSLPAAGWRWAVVSGLVHLPYLVALGRAYDRGDFSLAYPVARGGGALLAAIGGIVLLDDELDLWSVVAIVTIVAGMALLAAGAKPAHVGIALFVAVTIGLYTTVDSHAAREVAGNTYAVAVFVMAGSAMSVYGIVSGRSRAMVAGLRADWRQFAVTAVMGLATYALVLAAVRRAPVGYVAALRESSVLVAAFIGWRYLDEHRAHQRMVAAAVILGGLILLVVSG